MKIGIWAWLKRLFSKSAKKEPHGRHALLADAQGDAFVLPLCSTLCKTKTSSRFPRRRAPSSAYREIDGRAGRGVSIRNPSPRS